MLSDRNTRRRLGKQKQLEKLKILTINVRGLKSKLKSVESVLQTHGTHLAGITETHLDKGEEITLPGYIWIGKTRKNQDGGGVGFFV